MTFIELNKEAYATITDAEYFISCFLSDEEELRVNNLVNFETENFINIKADSLLERLSSYVYEKTNIHLNFIYCETENIIHFSCFKSWLTASEKVIEALILYLVKKFGVEIEEKGWCLIDYKFIGSYLDSLDSLKFDNINKEEVILKLIENLCFNLELNVDLFEEGLFLEKKVRKSA